MNEYQTVAPTAHERISRLRKDTNRLDERLDLQRDAELLHARNTNQRIDALRKDVNHLADERVMSHTIRRFWNVVVTSSLCGSAIDGVYHEVSHHGFTWSTAVAVVVALVCAWNINSWRPRR